MHYRGQSFEIEVPLEAAAVDGADVEAIAEASIAPTRASTTSATTTRRCRS